VERYTRRKQKLLLIIVFLLLVAIAFVVWKFLDVEKDNSGDGESQSSIGTITYNGRKYKYNSNLMNILFLGIDNNVDKDELAIPGDAGQSDCILILSLNKETKKATIWQIPRDTMTEVDIYDLNGNYYTTVTEQIATQFAYSIGGKSSCWATKKTVSELLFGLQIDGYLAMDMAGIPVFNDAVGGVTLTFDEDYSMVDPSFVKGTTITLSGKQAYDFVHYRDTKQSFSNNGRMQRQRQYIPAMIDAIKGRSGDGNYYEEFFPLIEKYIVTDLSENQINELADYELASSDIVVLPGEGKIGEVYEEFYEDEKKLEKNIIETFYILKD